METRRSQQNRGGGDGGSGAPSSPPGGGGMGGPTRCCLRRKERHGGGALGSVLRQALLGGFDSTGGVRGGWGGERFPSQNAAVEPCRHAASQPHSTNGSRAVRSEQLGGGGEGIIDKNNPKRFHTTESIKTGKENILKSDLR